MSEYLAFKLYDTPARKMSVWGVSSKQGGDRLGTIAWYGPWRQYTFEAERGCVFNHSCLLDIVAFLQAQNALQRKQAQTRLTERRAKAAAEATA